MAEITELGSAEGRFCGVLAAAIARRVTACDRADGPGRRGAVFYHYSESSLELATEVLARLELIALVGDQCGEQVEGPAAPEAIAYRPYALTMDADAMPAFLAKTVGRGDPRIDETIACFVNIACYYDGLSDERMPFRPPAALGEAMRMLARFGYAETVGDLYRWTDRIGAAMQACYLWSADLRSVTTLEREAGLTEAETAWRTMPESIRTQFFSGQPMVFTEFLKVLCRHWRRGQWHKAPREGWMSADRLLACRIIEIAEGRRATAR